MITCFFVFLGMTYLFSCTCMYGYQSSAVITPVEARLAQREILTSWFVGLKNKFVITNNITITIDAIPSVFEIVLNKAVVCFLENLHVSPGPLDSTQNTTIKHCTKLLMSKRIHEHNTWSCSKNSWLDVSVLGRLLLHVYILSYCILSPVTYLYFGCLI